MKKRIIIIIVFVLALFVFVPVHARTNGVTYRLAGEYDGCGVLGSVSDENSVAWLLNKIFDYVKIIGPILVVVLSSIDFLKVIFNGDDDAMKKAQKKLATRLVLAMALFFIPLLVQAMLSWFGITGNATCGIQ